MQKRKFLIILAAIIITSLIGLSAQCGLIGEAPTIELEIYDGPDYSESDDMCYYRVEATVEGIPDPEVTFDEDDNVDPLGSGRVEVGVEAGDSYTLTATAVNSQGTASVSIDLEGECDDMPAEVEEAGEEEAEEEEGEEEEAEEEEGDPDAENEAPTIKFSIYQGPTLEGGICYYRVKATVTGKPNPDIDFSKDDSGGSWLPKRVQINLNNPGDTYTLTATAHNSEGSDSDSISLSWGCAIPVPDPVETDVDIVADPDLSGYIFVGTGAWVNTQLYIGDTVFNDQIKAYLSFDIDDLGDIDGINIKEVSVTIPINSILNNPELIPGTKVNVKVYDYGPTFELGDQAVGGEHVKTFDALNPLDNFNFSTNKLKEELQKAVDVDKNWFQIKLGPSGILADGSADYYQFFKSDVMLHIKYEVPG